MDSEHLTLGRQWLWMISSIPTQAFGSVEEGKVLMRLSTFMSVHQGGFPPPGLQSHASSVSRSLCVCSEPGIIDVDIDTVF